MRFNLAASCAAAFLILVDQADVEGHLLQVAGDAQADSAAADDEDAGAAPLPGFFQFQHVLDGRQVFLVGNDEDAVAGLDDVVAAGDDGRFSAADGGYHETVNAAQFPQLPQSEVAQGAFRADAVAEEMDLSFHELGHVEGAGAAGDLDDLLGDRVLRVDEHVDAEFFFRQHRAPAGVFDTLHSCYPGRNLVFPGQQTGQDVHLIEVGDGDEDVGILYPRLLQDFGAGAVADNPHDVEAVLGSGEMFRVAIDQGDFVSFQRQALAKEIADLAGADDQDAHGIPVAVRG